jgi:broad specificity phosphatase PhoE
VAFRLRAALADLDRDHPDGRVLVVAHDAVIVLTRYIVEGLTEEQVLDAERTLVPNGSLTLWRRRDGALRLVTANNTGHLDGAGRPA